MGAVRDHRPVARIAAIFSRHAQAMKWAREQLEQQFGPIRQAMEPYRFDETSFYEREMGSELQKQLVYFEELMDPAELASNKLLSNDLEQRYQTQFDGPEERPLNIDPGYVSEAKLILATTKDRDHRIYLRDGIFAEVTLYFYHGQWTSRPWTYRDYQRDEVQQFLTSCRDDLRRRYSQS